VSGTVSWWVDTTRRVTKLRSSRSSAGMSSFWKSVCSVSSAYFVLASASMRGFDTLLTGPAIDEMSEVKKLLVEGRSFAESCRSVIVARDYVDFGSHGRGCKFLVYASARVDL
jgi:hypothetical protein